MVRKIKGKQEVFEPCMFSLFYFIFELKFSCLIHLSFLILCFFFTLTIILFSIVSSLFFFFNLLRCRRCLYLPPVLSFRPCLPPVPSHLFLPHHFTISYSFFSSYSFLFSPHLFFPLLIPFLLFFPLLLLQLL